MRRFAEPETSGFGLMGRMVVRDGAKRKGPGPVRPAAVGAASPGADALRYPCKRYFSGAQAAPTIRPPSGS